MRRSLALALVVVVSGCRLPTAALEQGALEPSSAAAPATFVEAAPTEAAEIDDPPVPGLGPGSCPAVVTPYPEPYFGDRVLIRLPEPVTSQDLVEYRSDAAKLGHAVALPGCTDLGPTLSAMILELRAHPDGERLEAVRNVVLGEHGLLEHGALIEAEVERGHGTWIYERGQTRLLVAVHETRGWAATVIYEAATAQWPSIVNSLLESSRKLTIVPF